MSFTKLAQYPLSFLLQEQQREEPSAGRSNTANTIYTLLMVYKGGCN